MKCLKCGKEISGTLCKNCGYKATTSDINASARKQAVQEHKAAYNKSIVTSNTQSKDVSKPARSNSKYAASTVTAYVKTPKPVNRTKNPINKAFEPIEVPVNKAAITVQVPAKKKASLPKVSNVKEIEPSDFIDEEPSYEDESIKDAPVEESSIEYDDDIKTSADEFEDDDFEYAENPWATLAASRKNSEENFSEEKSPDEDLPKSANRPLPKKPNIEPISKEQVHSAPEPIKHPNLPKKNVEADESNYEQKGEKKAENISKLPVKKATLKTKDTKSPDRNDTPAVREKLSPAERIRKRRLENEEKRKEEKLDVNYDFNKDGFYDDTEASERAMPEAISKKTLLKVTGAIAAIILFTIFLIYWA